MSNAKGVVGHWVGAGYTFGNSTDYKVANGDPGVPTSPGVGDGSAAFWAFPKAAFPAVGTAGWFGVRDDWRYAGHDQRQPAAVGGG